MSKEMTPKETLEKISWRFPNEPSFQEWCNIINQALDRLELLEKENKGLTLLNETQANIINELQQHRNSVENQNAALKIKVRAWEIQGEKFKKAIEILKEKSNIRLHILTNTDGSKIYEIEFILGYYSTIYDITQQEYELLKEVLE